MTKIFSILIIALLYFSTSTVADSTKIISYNIWNGFDWGKDSVREAKLLNWMNSQNPDIVALQELCAYTPERLKKHANSWGHSYSTLLKTSGYSVGLTSKYPIKVNEKIIEGMHHGALHCETNGIEIFVIHLSPFKWKKRSSEADTLLKRINREISAGKKVVVAGDYNALSPIDDHFYSNNEYLLENRRQRDRENKNLEYLQDGEFSYVTMSKFLSTGLRDVCAKDTDQWTERISCPTLVFAKNEAERIHLIKRSARIDYIMATSLLASKCIYAKVHNGEETMMLSDHYPVVAIFQD